MTTDLDNLKIGDRVSYAVARAVPFTKHARFEQVLRTGTVRGFDGCMVKVQLANGTFSMVHAAKLRLPA